MTRNDNFFALVLSVVGFNDIKSNLMLVGLAATFLEHNFEEIP